VCGAEPAEQIVSRWPKFGPEQRGPILEFLLKRPERIPALLTGVERNSVRATDLSAAQLQFLRTHRDPAIRDRGIQALGRPAAASRESVVDAYRSALQLKGAADNGRKIFQARCATCHVLRGEGTVYGVDLATVKNGGKEKVLTSILDPNREVAPNYLSYLVETENGESFTAIIANEGATSVTLRMANGVEIPMPRSKIKLLQGSGLSLMPEGLEQGLKPQDIADLLEFIVSGP